MTKPEFQDDGNWGNGAHSASHKLAVSLANTRHGGRLLERVLAGEVKFRQSHIDQINRVMLQLQINEREAVEFLRAASYDLTIRFLSAVEPHELPSEKLMTRLQKASNLYKLWDETLRAIDALEENIIDLAIADAEGLSENSNAD